MKKDRNERPEWARLAKKPGKATSTELGKALDQLGADRERLIGRQKQLAETIVDLQLEVMGEAQGEAGKDLAEAKAERSDIGDRLAAMGRAEKLLELHREEALHQERSGRLGEIKREIAKLQEQKGRDYEKGVKALAEGLTYLASAWGCPATPVEFGHWLRQVSRTPGGLGKFEADFLSHAAKVRGASWKNAAGQIRELHIERKKLEQKLGVGEFAPTEKKTLNFAEPPKIHVGLTDPTPESRPTSDGGLVAGPVHEDGIIDFRDL